MKALQTALLSAFVFVLSANGNPQPLASNFTVSLTGVAITALDAINSSGNSDSGARVNTALGGGGAFLGQLGITSTGSPAVATASSYQTTALWCIDSQTYFTPGASGTANVTLLSDVPSIASSTWYSTPLTWTNSGLDSLASGDTVQHRLEMAAWLVQQYGYTGFGEIKGGAAGTAASLVPSSTNADVQYAIWAVMSNSAFSTHNPNDQVTLASAGTNAGTWITLAANAINASPQQLTPQNWAVVTWNKAAGSGPDQTFLVQVTPEPGFYGALALGMSGLALMISRKRRSS